MENRDCVHTLQCVHSVDHEDNEDNEESVHEGVGGEYVTKGRDGCSRSSCRWQERFVVSEKGWLQSALRIVRRRRHKPTDIAFLSNALAPIAGLFYYK